MVVFVIVFVVVVYFICGMLNVGVKIVFVFVLFVYVWIVVGMLVLCYVLCGGVCYFY